MSVVSELVSFLAFASLAGFLFAFPLARFETPIHYDLWSEVDKTHVYGLVVYPIVFIGMWLGQWAEAKAGGGKASHLIASVNGVVGPFLALTQVHASYVSIYGPWQLPVYVVPVFLLVLAATILRLSLASIKRGGTSSASQDSGKKSSRGASARKARSPRSPRALIRSLSSPEEEDHHADADEANDPSYQERVTPVRRRRTGAASPRSRSRSRK